MKVKEAYDVLKDQSPANYALHLQRYNQQTEIRMREEKRKEFLAQAEKNITQRQEEELKQKEKDKAKQTQAAEAFKKNKAQEMEEKRRQKILRDRKV